MASSSDTHLIADVLVLVQSKSPVVLYLGAAQRAALPFKSRPAPTATVERVRYRYHPDSVPQIDKAAGDLQTPFTKAPFS